MRLSGSSFILRIGDVLPFEIVLGNYAAKEGNGVVQLTDKIDEGPVIKTGSRKMLDHLNGRHVSYH